MSTKNKTIIKSSLISGSVYALIMAGFEYTDGQDFRLWRFIINTLFFGAFMGLMTGYHLINEKKK